MANLRRRASCLPDSITRATSSFTYAVINETMDRSVKVI